MKSVFSCKKRRASIERAAFTLANQLVANGPVVTAWEPAETRDGASWVARFLEDFTDKDDSIIPGSRPTAIVVGDYVIIDIGLRMLAPSELFKAQGFRRNFIHDRDYEGKKITATDQVKMCGNSVSPYVAKALTEANYGVSDSDVEADVAVA